MHRPTESWLRPAIAGLACALALAGCNKPAANNTATPANNAAAPAAPAANSAAPTPASGPDAADAKAFLNARYANYKDSKTNTLDIFGKNAGEVFDPEMIALLKADNKALKGDLGTIDGDVLCNCQDYVSLQTTVTVLSATPTTAKAHADFTDSGIPSDGARHNDFDLVKVNGAWRIHDVTEPGQPSMRSSLQDEIKSLAKGPKKSDPDEAP
jgi:hypothetical protein